jgi:hypothetical protein
LFDRIRALVNPDLSRSGARLFEPTLDCLQRVPRGSARLAAKLELNLAIRLERDGTRRRRANQINDGSFALSTSFVATRMTIHDPPSGAAAVTAPILLLISETKNAIYKIRNF